MPGCEQYVEEIVAFTYPLFCHRSYSDPRERPVSNLRTTPRSNARDSPVCWSARLAIWIFARMPAAEHVPRFACVIRLALAMLYWMAIHCTRSSWAKITLIGLRKRIGISLGRPLDASSLNYLGNQLKTPLTALERSLPERMPRKRNRGGLRGCE